MLTSGIRDRVLIGLGLICLVILPFGADSWLRAAVILPAMMLLPGAAVLSFVAINERVLWVGLAVCVSLAAEAVVVCALLWLRVWHPSLVAAALLVMSMAVILVNARRIGAARNAVGSRPGADPVTATLAVGGEEALILGRRSAGRRWGAPATIVPRRSRTDSRLMLAAPGVVALILFAVSIGRIDPEKMGQYGLLTVLPVTWYLALVLMLGGAVRAMSRPAANHAVAAGYLLGIVLVLFGTAPLIYSVPHYSWVYNYVGVTRYILEHHALDGDVDIYQRWPGFFAVASFWSALTRTTDPLVYAEWAEVFFVSVSALLVACLGRLYLRSVTLGWLSALVFVLGNWVGQSYFAPQGLALTLALAVYCLLVGFCRSVRPKAARAIPAAGASNGRESAPAAEISRGPFVREYGRGLATKTDEQVLRRWAVAVAVLLQAAVVISHQLTPYLIVVTVVVLVASGLVRPWLLVILMALLAIAFLLPNLGYLTSHFSVASSPDPLQNLRRVDPYGASPVPGKLLHARAGVVLSMLVWLIAAISVLGGLRQRRPRTGVLGLLVVAPAILVLGQDYGGEAVFRVYLFSLPWAALAIASVLVRYELRSTSVRAGRVSAAALVGAAVFLPAFFGQEELNYMPAGAVEASDYFYRNAQPGAVLMCAAPNFPRSYGPNYDEFIHMKNGDEPNILLNPDLRGRDLGPADVDIVMAEIRKYADRGYLAFGDSSDAYVETFRLTPPGALARLEAAVRQSSSFQLWYRNEDVRIYALREDPAPGSAAPADAIAVRGPAGVGSDQEASQ